MAKKLKYKKAKKLEDKAKVALAYPELPTEATGPASAALLAAVLADPAAHPEQLTQQYAIPDAEIAGVTEYEFPVRKKLKDAVEAQDPDEQDADLVAAIDEAVAAGEVLAKSKSGG